MVILTACLEVAPLTGAKTARSTAATEQLGEEIGEIARFAGGKATPRKSVGAVTSPCAPGLLTTLIRVLHLTTCSIGETTMTTVNFTGSVDRELLKRAKVIAAKADTSINALFNAELRYLVETFEAAEASGNQNFRALLDFSLGRIDDHTTMNALAIDSEEDLFLLMAAAHLPMPRLPEAMTQEMADSLNALAS